MEAREIRQRRDKLQSEFNRLIREFYRDVKREDFDRLNFEITPVREYNRQNELVTTGYEVGIEIII